MKRCAGSFATHVPSLPGRLEYIDCITIRKILHMKITQTLTYKLGRKLICIYAQILLHMDVFWQAHLPAGPKLIVANHPSTTDPFYLMTLFPQPLSILIIEHAFKAPLFGNILRHSGHIPVLSADRHAAFDAAHQHLQDGRSVAIFPEGDLSPRQGGSLPARSGAARLALLTGAPVIPIGIYFRRERARALVSKFHGKSETGYWFLRGPYGVTVGEPMRFEGDVEDRVRVKSISEIIMEAINSLALASQRRLEIPA
jgi:1-acyl-sn-glycerol-3-phosphate acyltransferase